MPQSLRVPPQEGSPEEVASFFDNLLVDKPEKAEVKSKATDPDTDGINDFFDSLTPKPQTLEDIEKEKDPFPIRIGPKMPEELTPEEKIELENERDPVKIGEIQDHAPQHNLSDEQLKIRFDAEQAKSLGTKASDIAGGVLKAGKEFVTEGIPSLAKGVGTLAGHSLLALGEGAAARKSDANIPAEEDMGMKALEDWSSLGSGVVKNIEAASLSAAKAINYGTGIGDAVQETFGLKAPEQAFEDYKARKRLDESAALDNLKRPNRAAAIMADAQRAHSDSPESEALAQDWEAMAIKPNPNIEGVAGFLPTDPYFAALGGAGKGLALAKPVAARVVAPLAEKLPTTAEVVEVAGKGLEIGGKKTVSATKSILAAPGKLSEKVLPGHKEYGLPGAGAAAVSLLGPLGAAKALTGVAGAGVLGKAAELTGGVVRSTGAVMKKGAPGRNGLFRTVASSPDSTKLAKALFGGWRGKTLDAISHPAKYYSAAGLKGAGVMALIGLPNIEDAQDLGQYIGSGAGMGVAFGTLGYPRARQGALRAAQDADVSRMRAMEDPETQASRDALTDPVNFLSSMEANRQGLEQELVEINYKPETQEGRNRKRAIEAEKKKIAQKVKDVLEMSPEELAEARRAIDLEWTDNIQDMAKNVGQASGLGTNVDVHLAGQGSIHSLLEKIYAKPLAEARANIGILEGKENLSPSEKDTLTSSQAFLNSVKEEGDNFSLTRGWVSHPESTGAKNPTIVLNVDHLLPKLGKNLSSVIRHELLHSLLKFKEVREMMKPVTEQYFDQWDVDKDGNRHLIGEGGLYHDEVIMKDYAKMYARALDPVHDGSSFMTSRSPEEILEYMKEEILAEHFSTSAGEQGYMRSILDSAGLNILDSVTLANADSAVGRLRDALGKIGITTADYDRAMKSDVFARKFSPEALATMRQLQRKLKDYQDTLTLTEEEGLPKDIDIPLAKIMSNRALQEKYKEDSAWEKETAGVVTGPDGAVIKEIALNPEQALLTETGNWVVKGGKLVNLETGEVAPAQIENTYAAAALPEGTKVSVGNRIKRNPDGSPRILDKSKIEALDRRRGQLIKDALDNAPETGAGNRLKDAGGGYYRGVATPEQLARLNAIPSVLLSPRQKAWISKLNEALQRNDGTRFTGTYNAALRGGKYRSIAPKIVDDVPIGFQFSKAGNFLVTAISVSRLNNKLNRWAKEIPANLAPWGGDKYAFWQDFSKYLNNWKQGKAGESDLGLDAAASDKKKNILNDFLGLGTKESEGANTDRGPRLKTRKGQDSDDRTIVSRRLDRFLDLYENYEQKLPIDYSKAKWNKMPAGKQTDFALSQEFLDSEKAKLPKYKIEIDNREDGKSARLNIRNDDGDVVGHATVDWEQKKGGSVRINHTYINSENQGKGYGQALYREIAKLAQEKGLEILHGSEVSTGAAGLRNKLFQEIGDDKWRKLGDSMDSQVDSQTHYLPAPLTQEDFYPQQHKGQWYVMDETGTPHDDSPPFKTQEEAQAATDSLLDAENGKRQDYESERIHSRLFGDDDAAESRAATQHNLPDALSHLEGGGGSDGGQRSSAEETRSLIDFARGQGILLDKTPVGLKRGSAQDKGGSEHHAFRDGERWIKLTRGSTPTGYTAVPASEGWELRKDKSIANYLQRLQLQNEIFGDDIRLHAVEHDKHGNTSILISQPHVQGKPPTFEAMDKAMGEAGFDRIGYGQYYRPSDNLAVLDLTLRNGRNVSGKFLPFDAVLLHPDDAMKEALLSKKPPVVNAVSEEASPFASVGKVH